MALRAVQIWSCGICLAKMNSMRSIVVRFYQSNFARRWDVFVEESRNGTFLHKRSYMDYHADRFLDRSIMVFEKENLIAVLPANQENNSLVSHGGLTYGGLLVGKKSHGWDALRILEAILSFVSRAGYSSIVYRCIPHIYHRWPTEEDLYAIFRYGRSG